VIQVLAGPDGLAMAVAVTAAELTVGTRLGLVRQDQPIGIAVVTRIDGGLALASVIPDTATGPIRAGDTARVILTE
jgi:hypothetical protein